MTRTWYWNNKPMNTVGDIADAILDILKEKNSEKEATDFMRAYLAFEDYAEENVGYIIGYFDAETRGQAYRLFDVQHPLVTREIAR